MSTDYSVDAPSRISISVMKLLQNPMGVFGLFIIVMLVVLTGFANYIAPFDPTKIDVPSKFLAPSWEHWMGTDQLGRDVFSRALFGGRVALKVAIISTFVALSIGAVFGFVAAYSSPWVDNTILLILDTIRAFPMMVLALAVGPMFGAGIWTVIGILIATSVPFYARVVRTAALAIKQQEFIDAERAMGASAGRVICLHILPNIIGPILILVSMDIPVIITAEAGLSFLGVGIKPPDTSWGIMLDQGYRYIGRAPWLVVAAGTPVIIATLGFTFLGEALRDAFDPKFKKG